MRGYISLVLFLSLTGCSYSFFERPSNYPPGTTSGDFPDYDHYGAEPISTKRIPTEVAFEVIDLLKDVFLVNGPGEIKCADVNTFKKFVDLFFNTESGESPTLKYLCLFEAEKGEINLNWQLSQHDGLTWTIVPPYNLIDTDIHVLRSMDVFLNSSLTLTIAEQSVRLKLEGVTFNLSKSILKGTMYSWVPQFLLSFEVDKIERNLLLVRDKLSL